MSEDILTIRHNFSAWAASRAAMAGSSKATRTQFIKALEASGASEFLKIYGQNSFEQNQVDAHFDRWVIQARLYLRNTYKKRLAYGIFAKLIATYIKSSFTLGGYEETSFAKQCPCPIDSILIKNVDLTYGTELFDQYKWMKLTRKSYWKVVSTLRRLNNGRPFWMLESLWQP